MAAMGALCPEHGLVLARCRGCFAPPPPGAGGVSPQAARGGRCLDDLASWVLLVLSAYLRPEAFGLHRADVIRPSAGLTHCLAIIVASEDGGLRTKVGASDDSTRWSWAGRGPCGRRWQRGARRTPSSNYQEMADHFRRVASLLKIKAVPYQIRHSGPEWDRLRGHRTLAEVQGRGRWKTMSSLSRYERHARLAVEMNDLAPEAATYFRTCADSLEGCVLRGLEVPPRPRM